MPALYNVGDHVGFTYDSSLFTGEIVEIENTGSPINERFLYSIEADIGGEPVLIDIIEQDIIPTARMPHIDPARLWGNVTITGTPGTLDIPRIDEEPAALIRCGGIGDDHTPSSMDYRLQRQDNGNYLRNPNVSFCINRLSKYVRPTRNAFGDWSFVDNVGSIWINSIQYPRVAEYSSRSDAYSIFWMPLNTYLGMNAAQIARRPSESIPKKKKKKLRRKYPMPTIKEEKYYVNKAEYIA